MSYKEIKERLQLSNLSSKLDFIEDEELRKKVITQLE